MTFVNIIKHINMLMREVGGIHRLALIISLLMNRGSQKGNMPDTENNDRPKMPFGFGCYVCGSTFESNQERLIHLEKLRHVDLYSTGSPQGSEEIHRLAMIKCL
jgi:hypothetical protein